MYLKTRQVSFMGMFAYGWVFALVFALWPPSTARADALTANVILEVELDDARIIRFTLDDLRALPQTEFETSTVWTKRVDRYTGVLLYDLLHHIGVTPDSAKVSAHAIDGYSAIIDTELVTTQAPLLSFLRNGQPMPVRNQGPIWLIFPFDANPAFRTESIFAKSVWQVRALMVRK